MRAEGFGTDLQVGCVFLRSPLLNTEIWGQVLLSEMHLAMGWKQPSAFPLVSLVALSG